MRIIENKCINPEWPKKCQCEHCESIIEVDKDDVDNIGHIYENLINYYVYECPACMRLTELKII